MGNKKRKTLFAKNAMLNKAGHHSTGAIAASIVTETYSNTPDVSLQISDCSRAVSLSLGVWDAEERENSLLKLDIMLDVIMDLKDALEVACEEQEEQERKEAKKKKKEAKKAKKKKKSG